MVAIATIVMALVIFIQYMTHPPRGYTGTVRRRPDGAGGLMSDERRLRRVTVRDCQSAAMDVARRFIDFDEYGSESRALAALRRRCPGRSAAEYRLMLADALDLHRTAVRIVGDRNAVLPDVGALERAIAKQVPECSRRAAAEVAAWVWYWHVVR